MNILIKHGRCLKWLYSILFYVIIYLLLYWVLCFFGGSLFLLIFLDKFISRKRKRAKMLNLNMCTNQWVETSISIFATYWGLWMFMNVLHVFLVLSSWHTAVDHCETPAVCQKMWENIGDYYIRRKNQTFQPYINNVKKIHLLQIKYNYDWCSAALAAVHVNYYILKLQGPQQTSLGSSEDICRCCGLHIPRCAHSQSICSCKRDWFICNPG